MSTEVSSQSKPSGFFTFSWGILVFVLFALLVIIWIRATAPNAEVDQARTDERTSIRDKRKIADAEKLAAPASWVDKAKGIARIPIADAKVIAVTKLSSKKPSATQVKLDPTMPMPAPFDPNAAEPGPAPFPSAPQGAEITRFGFPAAATPASSAAPATQPINNSATSEITK